MPLYYLADATITLDFDKTLDLISADDPANYKLVAAGADGKFGTSDDVTYALTPVYSAAAKDVVLTIGAWLRRRSSWWGRCSPAAPSCSRCGRAGRCSRCGRASSRRRSWSSHSPSSTCRTAPRCRSCCRRPSPTPPARRQCPDRRRRGPAGRRPARASTPDLSSHTHTDGKKSTYPPRHPGKVSRPNSSPKPFGSGFHSVR